MGLPSIVSNINGCNEIIVEGENGVIIPSRDKDALYEAMLGFYEDRSTLGKMASKAREMVANRFDCHIVRKALYDFYASLEEK
jgi:glycosyltransferase involved in cell wall biosynthesis